MRIDGCTSIQKVGVRNEVVRFVVLNFSVEKMEVLITKEMDEVQKRNRVQNGEIVTELPLLIVNRISSTFAIFRKKRKVKVASHGITSITLMLRILNLVYVEPLKRAVAAVKAEPVSVFSGRPKLIVVALN